MPSRKQKADDYLRRFQRSELRPPVNGQHHAPTLVRDRKTKKHLPVLHVYSHTPEQVVEAITQSKTSWGKDEAKVTYRKLCKDGRHDPESPTILSSFLDAFDKIFFHKYLGHLCYIEVVDHLPDCAGDCSTHWRGGGLMELEDNYECRIRIKSVRGDSDYKQGASDRLHRYLGVLMHECCHAIIDLYSCAACEDCREHQNKLRVLGTRGHGDMFQDLAQAMEDKSEKHFGRRLDLHRVNSVAHDVAHGHMSMPRSSKLRGWGMCPANVQHHVGKHTKAVPIPERQLEARPSGFIIQHPYGTIAQGPYGVAIQPTYGADQGYAHYTPVPWAPIILGGGNYRISNMNGGAIPMVGTAAMGLQGIVSYNWSCCGHYGL